VEIDRFEKMYRMLIEDTKERLPNIKIILMEPFVLKGTATEEAYGQFIEVKEYAKVVKTLAKEYGLDFLPLQDMLDKAAEKFGASYVLEDGVHPTIVGAKLIADEWLKLFHEKIEKKVEQ
jgi:lysophospholipase L1-like esterase